MPPPAEEAREDRPTWDEVQAKLEVMADTLGVPREVLTAHPRP